MPNQIKPKKKPRSSNSRPTPSANARALSRTADNGLPAPDENGRILLNRAGQTYELTADCPHSVWYANADITLKLNGFTIDSVGHGVRGYVSWDDNNIFGQQKAGTRFHLQGPGSVISRKGHAVSSRRARDARIDGNVYLECHAQDMGGIRFGSGHFTAKDVTIRNFSTSTSNRHQMYATVRSDESYVAERVAIIGGNVGFYATNGTVIRNCFVSQDSFATNGYAVAMYRQSRCVIESNLFMANNGRGVIINGVNSNTKTPNNHVVRENLIFVREKPNQEFGAALTPPGIRVRYDATGSIIEGNFCLAMGGPGWTGCAGLYLTNYPEMHNIFRNNRFAGFLVGEPTDPVQQFGKAITLETQGLPGRLCRDEITSNIIEGNHYLLSLSGSDGYKNGAHNVPLVANYFNRTDGGPVFTSFADWAESRFAEIGFHHDVATARFRQMIAELRQISAPLRDDSYDVWTDERWRTPTTITIKGSGAEPPLRIRRSEFRDEDEHYPVNIKVES